MFDLRVEEYSTIKHSNAFVDILLRRSERLPWEPPTMGYTTVDCESRPVAFGFLRECEGNYAIFDGLLTDPDFKSEVRDHALELVVKELIKAAKLKNIKNIIGFTSDKHTLMRSINHGFLCIDQQLIALSLEANINE